MWIIAPDGSTMVNTDRCRAILIAAYGINKPDFRILAELNSEEDTITIINRLSHEYAMREMSRIADALTSGEKIYRLHPKDGG